jgi:hypothetical protein
LMFVLTCKFGQHCRFVWIQIQITSVFVPPIVWISLVFLQPSLLIYWGFFEAPLWQHQCSPEKTHMKAGNISSPTLIIKLVVRFMTCFELRHALHLKKGMKPPLWLQYFLFQ